MLYRQALPSAAPVRANCELTAQPPAGVHCRIPRALPPPCPCVAHSPLLMYRACVFRSISNRRLYTRHSDTATIDGFVAARLLRLFGALCDSKVATSLDLYPREFSWEVVGPSGERLAGWSISNGAHRVGKDFAAGGIMQMCSGVYTVVLR